VAAILSHAMRLKIKEVWAMGKPGTRP